MTSNNIRLYIGRQFMTVFHSIVHLFHHSNLYLFHRSNRSSYLCHFFLAISSSPRNNALHFHPRSLPLSTLAAPPPGPLVCYVGVNLYNGTDFIRTEGWGLTEALHQNLCYIPTADGADNIYIDGGEKCIGIGAYLRTYKSQDDCLNSPSSWINKRLIQPQGVQEFAVVPTHWYSLDS